MIMTEKSIDEKIEHLADCIIDLVNDAAGDDNMLENIFERISDRIIDMSKMGPKIYKQRAKLDLLNVTTKCTICNKYYMNITNSVVIYTRIQSKEYFILACKECEGKIGNGINCIITGENRCWSIKNKRCCHVLDGLSASIVEAHFMKSMK